MILVWMWGLAVGVGGGGGGGVGVSLGRFGAAWGAESCVRVVRSDAVYGTSSAYDRL